MIFIVVFLDIEIDGAVALIREPVVKDFLNQLLLLYDMAGGVRLNAWRQHVEGAHRVVIAVGVILRNLHGLELFQPCFLLDLIITLIGIMLQMAHVGDIPDVAYLIAQMRKVAEENVECDCRTGMAQVRVAVYGGSADVHAHVGCVQRLEQFFSTT